ncbi:fatty acid desaturase 4, chloroplastic-like [Chenopodium quinoa]|uniref:Lipid desaturase domain-containing protein n=1 Tax=Chenopodium quinoa TaxID=63459 RepID=A0A803LYB8_CHEQI|nr:fatty acid desaturase 4, chloroplastic-like [Chenopodium quinoa]
MSILPQQKNLFKSPYQHANKNYQIIHIIRTQVRCTATPVKPNLGPTRLVVKPSSTPPTPAQVPITPKGPRPDDPALKSTWGHRAWLASGCTTLLVSLAKCVAASTDSHIWAKPILSGLVGYILADLGSGVYHWGIDNYGDATTPLFGGQIDAFQGHHKWPWTITKRQFANNLHALARIITFTVLPINLVLNDPILLAFVGSFSGCIMFSQQFHAWSHSTKSKLPPIVVTLQDSGVLVSRLEHANHHRSPYNSNYCIVSGIWNKFLDENKILEALEMVIFFQLGVRPRSWSEPSLEWTEETSIPSSLPQ